MSKLHAYYSDWRNKLLTCPVCGWTDRAARGELRYFRELLDVVCPQCADDVILAIVPYPTRSETLHAANAGILEAISEMRRT